MADEDGPSWASLELGSLIRLPACSSDKPIPAKAKSSMLSVSGQDLCVWVAVRGCWLQSVVELRIAAGSAVMSVVT